MTSQNNHGEMDNFLNKLSDEASRPSDKFQKQLRKQLLDSKPKLNFRFWFMKDLKIITVLALTLITVSLTSVGYLLLRNRSETDSDSETVYLSGTEKDEVLREILLNNTPATFTNSEMYGTLADDSQTKSMILTNLLPYTELKPYNFQEEQFSSGPAIDRCPVYRYIELDNYASRTHSFYNGEKYMLKSMTEEDSGKIISYYLENDKYIIEYQGGKYAVKIDNVDSGSDIKPGPKTDETYDPEVVNEPNTNIENSIDQFFGDTVQVRKVENNGETTEYIITWKYESSCSNPYQQLTKNSGGDIVGDNNNQLMVEKLWIDAKNHKVQKEALYLESDSEENKVYSVDISTESNDLSIDEVKEIFTYDLSVELKEFEQPPAHMLDPHNNENDRDKFIKQITEILFENEINFLSVPNSQLISIYSSVLDTFEIPDYIVDRDFYPEGEYGDKLYKEANETLAPDIMIQEYMPLITTSYENGIDINTFAKPVDEIKYIEEFFMSDGEKMKDIKVRIDGKEYDAEVFVIKMPIGSSEVPVGKSEDTIEEYKPSENYESYLISFEYEGGFYIITGEIQEFVSRGNIELKSYVFDNKTDLDKLYDLIVDSFEATASDDEDDNF